MTTPPSRSPRANIYVLEPGLIPTQLNSNTSLRKKRSIHAEVYLRADRSELRETLRFLLLYARKRKVRKSRCAVRSVLGACGTHEAVGGVRRWRRSWVKIHPLPAAIQVLGRRKHRSAAPTGPSVASFAVQRVPGYGSGQPCRSADVHEVAARPGVLVQWSHVMGTAAPAAIPGRTPLFSQF